MEDLGGLEIFDGPAFLRNGVEAGEYVNSTCQTPMIEHQSR
ncbi:MAG: hypothetical protein OEV85_13485 [Candidatus Thorarchaeota archaeon]|nr:hypothetical protein [Candidatus Thorarchaeota archaeon]